MKNEASPSPAAPDASTPVVVGGGGKMPKSRNKKRLIKVGLIVVIILVLAGGAAAGWWFFVRQDPNYLDISKLNAENKYVAMAQKFASEPAPNAPKEKAIYYGNIGSALKSAKEYVYSERYYKLAEKIIDENKVDKKEIEVYRSLSELYKAMGNQGKADEYAKKEEDFLKANYSEEVLKQMREVKTSDRPR